MNKLYLSILKMNMDQAQVRIIQISMMRVCSDTEICHSEEII